MDCGDKYDNESVGAKPIKTVGTASQARKVARRKGTPKSNHARLLCSRAEYGTKLVRLSDWSVIKSGVGIPNDGASNQKSL